MRKIFLMSSVLFVAPFTFGESGEVSAQCVATTDCASLGYTETSCPNGGIKCPFGTTWSCKDNNQNISVSSNLGTCSGNAKNCHIGDILNHDGTCSENIVSGKAPIGVVVYIDSKNCGFAMTAHPVDRSVFWATSYRTLVNSAKPNATDAVKDFDSCANTQKMLEIIGLDNSFSHGPYALDIVTTYAPAVAPGTKGKWCLPAAGVLNSLIQNIDRISSTITKIGGAGFSSTTGIWSSTEQDRESAYFFQYNSLRISATLKNYSRYDNVYYDVYPVIAF